MDSFRPHRGRATSNRRLIMVVMRVTLFSKRGAAACRFSADISGAFAAPGPAE